MELLWKILKLEKSNISGFLIIAAVWGVIGMAAACAVTGSQTSINSYFPAGTVLAIGVVVLFHLVATAILFSQSFSLAVSMGITRRRFVWTYQAVELLEMAGITAVLYVIYLVEKTVSGIFFADRGFVDVGTVFQWKYLLMTVVLLWVLEFFMEGLLMRFGVKAFWGLYVVVMAAAIAAPRNVEPILKVVTWITDAANRGIAAALLVSAGAVGIWISWQFLRKQQVTA